MPTKDFNKMIITTNNLIKKFKKNYVKTKNNKRIKSNT